ncbi:MAG: PhoU domain-containing protein [Calditrichota bacterium]
MSFFKEILQLWHSEDLLAQAWEESHKMLSLSHNMFIEAVKHLRDSRNIDALMALKKRDWEINQFQKEVRRKVLTHYSLSEDTSNLANGLILINMVVDIERLGDYTKNIVDLTLNHPESIVTEEISEDLHLIETAVTNRFAKTVQAIEKQDSDIARALKASYKYEISKMSDNIVNRIISGQLTFGSESRSATVALYARYLKRIGSHLNNIATVLVNPFDTIGYAQ